MANPLVAVSALAKRQPLIVVGALGGVGLLAFMASRSGGTGGVAQDAPPAADNPDVLGMDTGTSGGADASPYAGPPGLGYDPFGGTGVDPYGGTGTGTGDYAQTTDGCSWPPPAIPAGYEGRGSWACNAGAWEWNWITQQPDPLPGTNPGACPLPKPTVPTRLAATYKYVCRSGSWRLVPRATKPGPAPQPQPKPSPNVSAGQHVTFRGHRNARNKLILDDRRQFTLQRAAHWTLGPAEAGDRTPGVHGGEVRVRRIKAAPGHAGLVGHWLKVG